MSSSCRKVIILVSLFEVKVSQEPPNLMFFSSSKFIKISFFEHAHIKSARYIPRKVEVRVFHTFLWNVKIVVFFRRRVLPPSGSWFGGFGLVLGGSESAPDLPKWCSRVGESTIFKISWFFDKNTPLEICSNFGSKMFPKTLPKSRNWKLQVHAGDAFGSPISLWALKSSLGSLLGIKFALSWADLC